MPASPGGWVLWAGPCTHPWGPQCQHSPTLPSPAPSQGGPGASHCLTRVAGSCAWWSQLPDSQSCSRVEGQCCSLTPDGRDPIATGVRIRQSSDSEQPRDSSFAVPGSCQGAEAAGPDPPLLWGCRWGLNPVPGQVHSPAAPPAPSLLWAPGTWSTRHCPAFCGALSFSPNPHGSQEKHLKAARRASGGVPACSPVNPSPRGPSPAPASRSSTFLLSQCSASVV